ncbi:MAG: hypothetical protein ACJ8FS_16390 [Sphingomicrobium sp.]
MPDNRKLDPRINPNDPIYVTIRRGPLTVEVMIDALLFDLAQDQAALIARPATELARAMFTLKEDVDA